MKVTIEITREDMLDPRSRHELTSSILMFMNEMWQQSKDLAKLFQEEEGLQQQEPKEQEQSKEESQVQQQEMQMQQQEESQQQQQFQEQPPETEYTLDYIRSLANGKAKSITNGKAIVIEIIKKYSSKGISSIKESDYSAFVQDLEAL